MKSGALYFWIVLLVWGSLIAESSDAAAGWERALSLGDLPMSHEGGTETTDLDRWWATDKAQHLVASFLLTGMISYHLHRKGNVDHPQALWSGAGITIGLGVLKECRDLRKPHPYNRFSLKDLVADLMGVGLGILLVGWWS